MSFLTMLPPGGLMMLGALLLFLVPRRVVGHGDLPSMIPRPAFASRAVGFARRGGQRVTVYSSMESARMAVNHDHWRVRRERFPVAMKISGISTRRQV